MFPEEKKERTSYYAVHDALYQSKSDVVPVYTHTGSRFGGDERYNVVNGFSLTYVLRTGIAKSVFSFLNRKFKWVLSDVEHGRWNSVVFVRSVVF